ncbi:MAG: hypothetical protein U9Q75_05010, partial [Pseudomonadota bacterium]|nr:hypothetical protein [Pseudomonadota bacterium]
MTEKLLFFKVSKARKEMKCSSCGAFTWGSHGPGRAVLCKKCFGNGASPPVVYFQVKSAKPEENPVKLEEISFEFKENPAESEGNSVKVEETLDMPEENPVQLEENPVGLDETSEIPEENSVNPDGDSVKVEKTLVEPESPREIPDQEPADYKSSAMITRFVSYIGWFLCCLAILIVFIPFIDGKQT